MPVDFDNVISLLIGAAVPLITEGLVSLKGTLKQRNEAMKEEAFLKKSEQLITLAEAKVRGAVRSVNQTYVKDRKRKLPLMANGQRESLNSADKLVANRMARSKIQSNMTTELQEAIKTIYGDYELWLEDQIEAAVWEANNQVYYNEEEEK